MDSNESVAFLREGGWLEKAESLAPVLKKAFTHCLNVQDERVLILGDQGTEKDPVAPILAGAYYLAAKELNLNVNLVLEPVRKSHEQAEENVIEALQKLPRGAVIALAFTERMGSLGGVTASFRRFAEKNKHRFVSSMSLGDLKMKQLEMLAQSIDVSYKAMRQQMQSFKEVLDGAKEVRVTSPAGTNLHFDVSGQVAVLGDGDLALPGSGGNLPAGEVYIPSNGRNVEGVVVIDGSSRRHDGTVLIKEPISLFIEEGQLVNIEGGAEAEQLQKSLDIVAGLAKKPGALRRVGELGLGFNPNTQLVGSSLLDTKASGIAHVGIGSNNWFGGNVHAAIHWVQTFKNASFVVDGKKVEL